MFANTPKPPYYAVIFTKQGDAIGKPEYMAMFEKIHDLAKLYIGFIGMENVVSGNTEVTISYWTDSAAIRNFKQEADHLVAQTLGRTRWYDAYHVRVTVVERDYFVQREDAE